jgi:glutamate-1-semialdehyde 2,1-aminomutase
MNDRTANGYTTMNTTIVERSLQVFPAGCNGEFNLPAELATVLAGGQGAALRTADGKKLLDFSMGWGSVLLGHAHPAIAAAVTSQLSQGTNFAYVTEASLELAECLVELSPACESVRFCASGTEATMYCLRLARAFADRSQILKFEGAYHGGHDVGVTSLFPPGTDEFPQSVPASAGTVEHLNDRILTAPFNDLSTTTRIVEQHRDQLAAVIVEPLQRCLPPQEGFLAGLRALTQRCGILLIFDEVVTGFRLAYRGAQEFYGVTPDLVAYGKALGGGLPIGAYGGRRDIMDLVREDRMGSEKYVWTASTLGGNPLSAAAAVATLKVLRQPGTYERLHELGRYLRHGIANVLKRSGIEGYVLGDGPLAQVAFTATMPTDYRSSIPRDQQFARRLMLEMFRRGIFLNPMGTKLYLSLAHDENLCDQLCDTMADSLATLS